LQKPKSWDITAEIPGVDKKDIKVQVDGDVLSLSVEKSAAKEDKKEENGVKYHR
jgi:HSP20 family protein